jgi:hypothetical protein
MYISAASMLSMLLRSRASVVIGSSAMAVLLVAPDDTRARFPPPTRAAHTIRVIFGFTGVPAASPP